MAEYPVFPPENNSLVAQIFRPVQEGQLLANGKPNPDYKGPLGVANPVSQAEWDSMKDKVSSEATGYTAIKAIQSSLDNPNSGVGIYAGDLESYSVFAPMFDRVIEMYHGYKPDQTHVSDLDATKIDGGSDRAHLLPGLKALYDEWVAANPDASPADSNDPAVKVYLGLKEVVESKEDSGNADPEGKRVLSTRIRVGRSMKGKGLSPGISKADRLAVEKLASEAFAGFSDAELQGSYYPLTGMAEDVRAKLVADHFLFKRGDKYLESAGANRDWPEARGIFHNNDKTFLVWINEEDQLRIISMEMGADIRGVFARLTKGIAAVEAAIKANGSEGFQFTEHLGFIHSCPTNLGTGLRGSVHVKLPLLSASPDFKKICELLELQPRGIHGEHSESAGGVYDISNKKRIGQSEVQLVQTMLDGVRVLIKMEDTMAANQA